MNSGQVKWFNNAKGFGFILPEDTDEDYFVHYSSIVMDGYKTLKAGQAVSFDTVGGPKGTHAINVRPIESPAHATETSESEVVIPEHADHDQNTSQDMEGVGIPD